MRHHPLFLLRLCLLLSLLAGLIPFAFAQELPEDQWLIFWGAVGEHSDIFRTRLDGSELQNLTKSTEGVSEIEALSPDQEWIYFEEDNQIYRVRTDGTDRQTLTTEGDVNVFDTLSLDGEWIFFNRDRYDLVYRMRSDGSEISRAPTLDYFPMEFGWSPDGEWMFFIGEWSDDPDALYRMSADGRLVENVTDSLFEEGIKFEGFSFDSYFLPNKDWLLFQCAVGDRISSICRMHYDGSEAKELTPFNTYSWFITPSPDKEWLYFSSTASDYKGANLYRMHLDGSNIQQVTDFSAPTNFEGFTPDGDQMLVWKAESEGQKNLYRMNLDGSASTLLLSTDLNLSFIRWSLDGQWMVFVEGDYRLFEEDVYRMTTDGEHLENITHNPGAYAFFQWSSDGNWLVYTYETKSSTVFSWLNFNTLEIQLLELELAYVSDFRLIGGD